MAGIILRSPLQAKTQEEKDAADKELKELRGHTNFYFQASDLDLKIMRILTKKTPEPFVSVELVERMAQFLNYLLGKIAGPKTRTLDLKVTMPAVSRQRRAYFCGLHGALSCRFPTRRRFRST